MAIKQLSIVGLRGFSEVQKLNFGVPNGDAGSGLTYVLGQNNSGKSTVTEALRLIGGNNLAASEGKRNKSAGDRIDLKLEFDTGEVYSTSTVTGGGAPLENSGTWGTPHPNQLLVIPSRRQLNSYFQNGEFKRNDLQNANKGLPTTRDPGQTNYHNRFTLLAKNNQEKAKFDVELSKVLGAKIDWTIDQVDTGQFYLKLNFAGNFHSSDGAGEGLTSLFVLVDALRDAQDGEMICIDEPELSLHPAVIRRLSLFLIEHSRTKQILISTHSPMMIDWQSVSTGARLVRCKRLEQGIRLFELKDSTRKLLVPLLSDLNNPHLLGLDASEVFFLDDKILLTEGQEDVIFLPKILQQLGIDWHPQFLGWGTGGASKMGIFVQILNDLGYEKIVGLLDGDKQKECKELQEKFPQYRFVTLPADDVRTKKARPAKDEVKGALDDKGVVRPELAKPLSDLINDLKAFLT